MIIVTEPVGSDLQNVVLRLGGFHTEMSFLGCIGHLMAASGLQELLEMIYASNAVVHMVAGFVGECRKCLLKLFHRSIYSAESLVIPWVSHYTK